MKKRGQTLGLIAAAAVLCCTAVAEVTCDPSSRRVTFTATATGCGVDTQLEFLFVGPGSDHDYEAMFVTDDSIASIASAFEKAGIPRGRDIDAKGGRFWPTGHQLVIEPALTNVVREMRGEPIPPIVFTGGKRDEKGIPEACTNSPNAVFALYNCAQSVLQLDDALDQSAAYGRFQPAVGFAKGERKTFSFSWNGQTDFTAETLKLEPGRIAEALKALKVKSERCEIDVLCDFSSDLTLKEAITAATALSMIDSVRTKINGQKEGQFFYRAFLPLEKWRDRKERLAQPPEVHLAADGSIQVVEILEDWSDPDSLDPVLTVMKHPCPDLACAARLASKIGAKTFTVLIYASPDEKLARLYDLRRQITGPILNWYIFTE